MSKKPYQAIALAALALSAMATERMFKNSQLRDGSNFTTPVGNPWGSGGINMALHNRKMVMKRRAMAKMARASRKRNQR